MNSLEVLSRSEHSLLHRGLGDSFKKFGDSAERAADAFGALTAVVNSTWNVVRMLFTEIGRYPYKRSLRLAAYGSPRVRKKNAKRVARWVKKNRIN